MAEKQPKSKYCPSCGTLTPPEQQVERVSRSVGKTTVSFRCKACANKGKKSK